MRSIVDNGSVELAPIIASSSRIRPSFEDDAGLQDHEPLLSAASGSSLAPLPPRGSEYHWPGISAPPSPESSSYLSHSLPHSLLRRRFHFYKATMEKTHSSKFKYYARKLAVESEPGLTNAQLMLTNHDLKPGMKYLQCRHDVCV
jgi:hypothetical protein